MFKFQLNIFSCETKFHQGLSILSATGCICVFQQCGLLTRIDSDKSVQPPVSLETPNDVQSHCLEPNSHRIFKRLAKILILLHRLVGAFFGHTYLIYGNLSLRLICF